MPCAGIAVRHARPPTLCDHTIDVDVPGFAFGMAPDDVYHVPALHGGFPTEARV